MIRNALIILLFLFSLVQASILVEQDKAIDRLDSSLTYVVHKCTGVYIPTLEERNRK